LEPFEERVLEYLRQNKSTQFTVYQIANAMGTAGAGVLLANTYKATKFEGYAVGVQLVRNALDRLVDLGYVERQVEGGLLKESLYRAR
jgi:Fe2+ or Zn2+ uptake regulation protein